MKYKIPESLSTQRLEMKKVTIEHWPELHQYYSDVEGTRYTTGRALTEGESWRLVATLIGHWEIHGYGPYTLLEKETAKVLGVVGLWYPGDWPEPEIKWALLSRYTGQGYASEAVREVQAMAHQYLPELKLISLIFEKNLPSRQLAVAVGASFERTMMFRDKQAMVYRHPSLC